MLPHPSKAQIFSSAPSFQTLSAYVPPSMWATKFRTHTKLTKLTFCVSWSLHLWIAKWKTKDSAPNDSRHSLTSICSRFLCKYNFDSFGFFARYLNRSILWLLPAIWSRYMIMYSLLADRLEIPPVKSLALHCTGHLPPADSIHQGRTCSGTMRTNAELECGNCA